MYASCPRYYDEIGRGNLTAEQEREIREKLPAFDPVTARSARDNGTLVEFLRTYPDSRVNSHVARFLFWGKQSEQLMSPQPWDYPFGLGSPLHRFLALDGRIVLLGSDHDTVTFLHCLEHVADIPGKRIARYQVPVIEDGRRVWRTMEEFDTSDDGVHPHWPHRFFAKIVDSFFAKTGNNGALVGNAATYIFSARELFNFALPIMKAVAEDASAAEPLTGTEHSSIASGRLNRPSVLAVRAWEVCVFLTSSSKLSNLLLPKPAKWFNPFSDILERDRHKCPRTPLRITLGPGLLVRQGAWR